MSKHSTAALKINLFLFIIITVLAYSTESTESSGGSTSFDSLIASQCISRCLSLYPWKFLNSSQMNPLNNDDKKNVSNLLRNKRVFTSNSLNNSSGILLTDLNQHNSKHPPHSVKWHKVMETCSKNSNCLQCTIPCDIPTNLLPNCKYLCKNENPLCIESCNLLNKIKEEKHGSCINFDEFSMKEFPLECTNNSLKASQLRALKHNNQYSHINEQSLNECAKDSDCVDMKKCCFLNSKCTNHGKVCLNPQITNQNLPSVPFNLKIVERKKGKTIILSWDCNYNKNKPTLFVVEGRWSLKQPQAESHIDSDSYMTKWGYLAQIANNNWIILRNINRGRWYKFRVAAVSKTGTHGYSKPTELFILSSAPKPPSEPQNLTVLQMYPIAVKSTSSDSQLENYINVDIGWIPSRRSDLPILNYKITWKRRLHNELAKQNQNISNNQINKEKSSTIDYDSEENIDSTYNLSADLNNLDKVDYGSDLIDAQNSNKYTIQKLLRHSIYTVELVAISKYDQELLISNAQQIRFDTNNLSLNSNKPTLLLLDETVFGEKHSSIVKHPNKSRNDIVSLDEEDDEDEDEDVEKNQVHRYQSHSSERNQRLIIDQQKVQNDLLQRPSLIRNLSVHSPFFQNGLVKAKLSWQLEENNAKTQEKLAEEISINFIADQPMFTITWFAIKCIESKSISIQKPLPTPITATTINTNFEIYELKYNCDYVVNVRLANNKQTKNTSTLSSSLNRLVPPQIASAQFKVPSCNHIKLIGRIRPICPVSSSLSTNELNLEIEKDKLETMKPILFSSITSTVATTLTPDKINTIQSQLPPVSKINYKILKSNPNDNLYTVEFSWLLQRNINKNSFSGYQISIVPKEIPGIASNYKKNDDDDDEEGSNFIGSVGAIVEKEKESFIATQLSSSIRYIFQLQLIGLDSQSYGPASNLEFLVNKNDDFEIAQNFSYLKSNEKQHTTKKKIFSNQNIRMTDYDSSNSNDNLNKNSRLYFTSSKTNEAISSLSSSNLILNNSNSLLYLKSFNIGVTLILTLYCL